MEYTEVTAKSIVDLVDAKRREVQEYKYAIDILSDRMGGYTFDRTITGIKQQLLVAQRELDELMRNRYYTGRNSL